MKWELKHDETCCQIYLNEIVKNQAYTNNIVNKCVNLAKEEGLPFPENSIKMKFANIKAICDEEGIKHSSPFKPLSNYSQQNKIAFSKVFKDYIEK